MRPDCNMSAPVHPPQTPKPLLELRVELGPSGTPKPAMRCVRKADYAMAGIRPGGMFGGAKMSTVC